MFPDLVQSAIAYAWTAVQQHPQHQLLPGHRLAIYRALDNVYGATAPRRIRAHLGILTARPLIPYWKAITPLWPDEPLHQDDPEPADEELPTYFLALTEQAWLPGAALDNIVTIAANYHYVMGNLRDELWEWRTPTTQSISAYYAMYSAYLTLSETLGWELLAAIPPDPLASLTDDAIAGGYYWHQGDAASAALTALIGYGKFEKAPTTSAQTRLAFWQWWLTEALPQSKVLAKL
jgi:hypothetical protein